MTIDDMTKILEIVTGAVADKVLVKLWETERMKDFLAGKKQPGEIHIDDVTGLTQFIKRTVKDEVEDNKPDISASDISDFETEVTEICEKVVEKTTYEVSATP